MDSQKSVRLTLTVKLKRLVTMVMKRYNYIGTFGDMSKDVVLRYIQNQKTEEMSK